MLHKFNALAVFNKFIDDRHGVRSVVHDPDDARLHEGLGAHEARKGGHVDCATDGLCAASFDHGVLLCVDAEALVQAYSACGV